MADENGNSEARIGWGSEFLMAKADGTLFELDEVTEVALPEEMADDVEVTHMKSPGKRKEYKPGLIEPGDGQIVLNYIPGSDTDVFIREAQNSGTVRAFQTNLPDETGAPAWAVKGFLYVKSRSRAVPIGDRLTCTVNVRFTGASDEAAYEAPARSARSCCRSIPLAMRSTRTSPSKARTSRAATMRPATTSRSSIAR